MMGIDFSAILDHRLSPEEILELAPRLDETVAKLRAVWSDDEEGARWHVPGDLRRHSPEERLQQEGYLEFDGPLGFTLNVAVHSAHLWHTTSFDAFVRDPRTRKALRQSCRCVGEVLGSTRALYLGDNATPASEAVDLVAEGEPFDGIVTFLKRRVGAPEMDIAMLSRSRGRAVIQEQQHLDGYFVERLSDIPAPAA